MLWVRVRTQRFPTSPEVPRHAERVGMRCARPWNLSSQRMLQTHPFRTISIAPPPVRALRTHINHLPKKTRSKNERL